jgi:hypothetical protein
MKQKNKYRLFLAYLIVLVSSIITYVLLYNEIAFQKTVTGWVFYATIVLGLITGCYLELENHIIDDIYIIETNMRYRLVRKTYLTYVIQCKNINGFFFRDMDLKFLGGEEEAKEWFHSSINTTVREDGY